MLDLRRAPVVVLVPYEDNFLARRPALDSVGSRPDRMTKESCLGKILARQEMCRQKGLRHIVEERLVVRGKTDAHSVLVHRRDLAHILEVRALQGPIVWVEDRLDGELHIVRAKRLPIVPRHVRAEVKGIGVRRRIIHPRLRECGNRRSCAVAAHESVKEQRVDLPVLITQRIDPLIVVRAADNLRPGHLRRPLLPTAGNEHKKYRHDAQQRLLHPHHPLIESILSCVSANNFVTYRKA